MRYDAERNELVIKQQSFPVEFYEHADLEFPGSTLDAHRTRHAIIRFENMWGLSMNWSTTAYGCNYILHYTGPFIEEPDRVEVGILDPRGRVVEGTVWDGNDGEPVILPDFFTGLWMDPLCYVDDEGCLQLIFLVSKLPSSGIPSPQYCETLQDVLGFLATIH